jgi:hypothetical protein
MPEPLPGESPKVAPRAAQPGAGAISGQPRPKPAMLLWIPLRWGGGGRARA